MPEIITPYGTWDLPAQWDANNGYGFRAIDSVDGTSIVRLLAPALALTKQAEDARDAAQGALAGALAAMPTRWSFDTATGAADPGSGKLRLNNATQNAATAIYVDSLNADGDSVAALLAALGGSDSTVKATITLIATADPTKWLEFAVTGVTDSTGYYTLAVTPVGGSAASPFADGAAVALARSRTGDKGDTGSTGATGATGAKGDPGDIADLSVYPTKPTPVGADLVPIGDSEAGDATKVTTVDDLRDSMAGTNVGDLVQLDGAGALPAVSGANLTGIEMRIVWLADNAMLQPGQRIIFDSAAASRTATLPATPAANATVKIGRYGAESVTVARNGSTIAGAAEDLSLDVDKRLYTLTYTGTTWLVIYDGAIA